MKWILRGIGALLALVVLAAAGLIVIDQASLPKAPARQALLDRAKAYDVRIRRDDWGVPHVLGKTDADAAFGLGYAQSEDDFATLQDVVLATRGVLAPRQGQDRRADRLCHRPARRLADHQCSLWRAAGRAAQDHGGLCRRGQRLCRQAPGEGQGGPAASDRPRHRSRLRLQAAVLLRPGRRAEAPHDTGRPRRRRPRDRTAWRPRLRAAPMGPRGC